MGKSAPVDAPKGPPAFLFWMAPDSDNLVVLVDGNGVARTYATTSGAQVAEFPGRVAAAVPSENGRQVITSEVGDTFRLRVWDARTARPVATSAALAMPPTFLQSYGSTVVGLLQETSAELVVWNWSGSPDSRVDALGTGSVGDFVDGEFVTSLALDKKRNLVRVASEREVRSYSLDDGSAQGRTPQLDG